MSGYHPIEAIAVGIANGRVNPNNVQTETVIRGVREAAHAKAVQLQILKASTEGEIDAPSAL